MKMNKKKVLDWLLKVLKGETLNEFLVDKGNEILLEYDSNDVIGRFKLTEIINGRKNIYKFKDMSELIQFLRSKTYLVWFDIEKYFTVDNFTYAEIIHNSRIYLIETTDEINIDIKNEMDELMETIAETNEDLDYKTEAFGVEINIEDVDKEELKIIRYNYFSDGKVNVNLAIEEDKTNYSVNNPYNNPRYIKIDVEKLEEELLKDIGTIWNGGIIIWK